MTLRISDGRLRITDGSRTVFDTDDRMLHVLASISGQTSSFAYLGGDGVGYDLNDTVTLGTVPAACTQVIGAVKFDLSSNYPAGFRFDRWHMVMGGTMLWVMDGEPGFQGQLGSNFGCSQYCAYHFSVSGGVVRLHRRVVIDRTPFQYVIRPHRLIYKLRCGAWS